MSETEKWKQVQKTMEHAVAEGETVGCSILVFKNGRELYYAAAGMADKENEKRIERDTIFRLYSMTKPVTAAAAMILVERGRIDLMDPVSLYLPGFKNQNVLENGEIAPVKREVEIKDLFNMTSGLIYPDHTFGQPGYEMGELFDEIIRRLDTKEEMTTIEVGNRMGQCTLAFQPGTSWKYGTSADVLGAVVEAVSGMSFGEFLEQEIFNPLGMEDTGFWVKPEKLDRLARVYERDAEETWKLYQGNHLGIRNTMDRSPGFESGGAGLVSTLDDYMKFAQMLLRGGMYSDQRILTEKAARYLTSAGLSPQQKEVFSARMHGLEGYSYSNFMRIMTDSGQAMVLGTEGDYGWDGWLGGYFENSPADQITFVMMMQRTETGTCGLTRRLKNMVWSLVS